MRLWSHSLRKHVVQEVLGKISDIFESLLIASPCLEEECNVWSEMSVNEAIYKYIAVWAFDLHMITTLLLYRIGSKGSRVNLFLLGLS